MSAPLDPRVLEEAAPGAWLTPRTAFTALLLAALALVPIYAILTGDTFAMTLFTRILIFALGAVSLNLIMGYGGMVSFGHAVYLGIGGYAVGILAKEGIASGFVQWPVAIAASALYALVVGALSLRTRGVYFIMITLAFAQMIYYVAIGLDRYGGDDGLTIYKRSQFGGLLDLQNKAVFYYLCLALLARQRLSGGAPRQFALRLGDPRRALERPAHAGDRLSDLSLPARLLRDRRRALRACRGAPCQPHQLHQSGADALDALGRSHRHGGPGRARLAVRAADRRRGVSGAGGGAVAAYRISRLDPRAAAALDRHLCERRHRRAARGPPRWLSRSCRSKD